MHAGRKRLAPAGSTLLRSGDVLFVNGEPAAVEELLRLQGVAVESVEAGELPAPFPWRQRYPDAGSPRARG